MAKNAADATKTHLTKRKRTSIGGNTKKTSSMNKSKKRQKGY